MSPFATAASHLRLLTGRASPGARWARLALWLGWLAAAGYLAAHHVVWRDEVRAFTLALSGDTVWDMLRAIQGEGHPALWYLLLRGAYALTGMKEALPATAFLIAAAATGWIAWRAPFRPLVLALILFSGFALVDYAVVARNYGLAMLLMVAIADLYPTARDRGVTLGVLLALLCNTNVPAVLLAGGVLLFWAVELWGEQGWRWTPAARQWVRNAGVAGLGVAVCFATVFPPYNDAASLAAGGDGWLPLAQLSAGLSGSWAGVILFGAMLVGSLAGLARAPAALAAAATVMVAFALFFQFVYPGLYRHQALVLVFLLVMYWLVASGRGGRWGGGARWRAPFAAGERWGIPAFVGLLAMQAAVGATLFGFTIAGEPFSRSRELGQLMGRPELRRAVVIGNPDVMLEPLSYYAPNPVWFVRERRLGRVVAFTRAAMRDVSLGEVLGTAHRLRRRTGRPVAIVLHDALDARAPVRREQGFLGGFTTTPAEVHAFQAATRRIARFGEAQTDETYDVYLLR